MIKKRLVATAAVALLAAQPLHAACMNKFLRRTEGTRQIITFLTGKLTFEEAKALAAAIEQRKSPPLTWIDDKGREVAKQFGELKIVRPMPVGCDGRASGVVLVATFPTPNAPARKMTVKLDASTTVDFEESAQ
jgi:hypothetical protein